MEIIGLQQRDVDYERGTLMVRQGKGKKDRMIPIGDRALAWVARYRDEVRTELVVASDDGTLFLTVRGQAFSDNRMTQMVRNCMRAAGVGNIGSCHLFRHAMATQMPENGADVRFIQAMHGPCGHPDDAGVHAGQHPGAEGYPFGYASRAAWSYGAEDRRGGRRIADDG